MDNIVALLAPTVISLITAHYAHKYLDINLGMIMITATFLLLFVPIGIDELMYRAAAGSSPLASNFRVSESAVTNWLTATIQGAFLSYLVLAVWATLTKLRILK